MKIATSGLAALLLVGSLAGSAMAQDDGIVFKQEFAPGSNYCHIQMRAIQSEHAWFGHSGAQECRQCRYHRFLWAV